MKIGQYKLANEWMREESATPEEALNTWNEMEAEFKANRAMIQEPRTMDQASLKDDLEPGPLKDEMLGKFNPDQETYEEYLQRINLERPFNMNQGGRIGFWKGGKPLYKNVPDQPHIKQHPVSKKYLVTRSVRRDGKTTQQYKGGIDDIDEAIKIRDEFVTNLPAETTAQTNIRTKTFTGKLERKELNKAARWFYKRGEVSSPNFIELDYTQKKKIRDNVDHGHTPGKFSKITQFTPLKKSEQNKILKQFPEADFELYKYGFSQAADQQSFDAVHDFIERGYKPAFHNVKQLPKKTQNLIEEAFGKQIADAGIDLNFGPGRKFGISPKEDQQLYNMVKNFIQNTGKKYPYAFSFENPENWIISQMHRASKNNDAYKMLYNDAGRIIGVSENGVEYYHANSKMGNTITNHPEAPKISKFVSVAKNAKANIPQSLMKMFPEGFDTNLIRSDRAYNDLLQWLDNSQGRRLTHNAINIHHAGAGGVRGNPALAKDLQLLTSQDNITAEVIKNQILNNDFSRVQELKDKGIRLNVGGKEYGAGIETPEQGLRRIETQAGTKLTERLKADPELKGFKKFLEQDVVKKFRANNIPCIKGEGGKCISLDDYKKGYNKTVAEAADGSKEAIQKLKGFTKSMRALTGAAKWTGYGLLAEIGFMVPFAIGDYAAGKSWKQIVGNATDYGFGPIFGQSELEEFKEYLPKGSAAVQRRKVYELDERLYNLENQKVNPGYGRVGYRQKAEDARQKVYDDLLDEYILNMQPFMRPSPHTEQGQFYDQGLMDKAEQEDIDTMKRIAAADAARKDERIERGIIADRNWQSQIAPRYTQGGIASLNVKK